MSVFGSTAAIAAAKKVQREERAAASRDTQFGFLLIPEQPFVRKNREEGAAY